MHLLTFEKPVCGGGLCMCKTLWLHPADGELWK